MPVRPSNRKWEGEHDEGDPSEPPTKLDYIVGTLIAIAIICGFLWFGYHFVPPDLP